MASKPRGWVSLYGVAFILMAAAGAALGASAIDFLTNTKLLWISTGLSGAAILISIVGVLLPRR
jgi:hypothetical protein